ncbi:MULTISPECIES: glycine--tRNA ligase subunit beta [Candidatus Ichthyocystis]|uniref:Glycine--tRNA ligase beta subunit n=2 Tax=Candidatus Ichthyocystis TaxID=2929841 RepID=A0A0S4M3G6_9BURK|nr:MULTISPECIES: glycine--tRNA ligase subunit beta [Ichthyocystis]CUT17410.1 glycyl-tRNA synthetase subunit beta [Candidatus Ichthyocystis hellenicum]
MSGLQQTLLIEIGTEEIPAKDVTIIRKYIAEKITEELEKNGFISPNTYCYTTPRRIAFIAQQIPYYSNKQSPVTKIMPSDIAYTAEGKPTEALIKKLQRMDPKPVLEDLSSITIENERLWVVWKKPSTNIDLEMIIEKIIFGSLHKIPSLKEMKWLTDQSLPFVRPIRTLLIMHGEKTIPAQIAEVKSANTVRGHRVLCAKNISIKSADTYEKQMKEEGFVVVRNEERIEKISQQIMEIAKIENVHNPIEDSVNKELIHEVSNMVEYPKSYCGTFPTQFLQLPPECLELTMRLNQKYVILKDNDKKIINKFIMVSNNAPQDPKCIIQGNERVLKARLADAEFFWNQDLKHSLDEYAQKLPYVIYHTKLGTQQDRTNRILDIAKKMAQLGKLSEEEHLHLQESCRLSKVDLLTLMVQEFPELQGIMGSYYAKHENKPQEIVKALYHQYDYSFDESDIGNPAIYLNISEKLESLVGFFSIDEIPTGEKDPFALRRKALGIVRAYIKYKSLPTLSKAISIAQEVHNISTEKSELYEKLSYFIMERAKNYAVHVLHYDKKLTSCVLKNIDDIPYIKIRHEELQSWINDGSMSGIIEVRKRIENITKNSNALTCCNTALMTRKEEMELWEKINRFDSSHDCVSQLNKLACCVEILFERVMINDSNISIRNNRIALLNQAKRIFDCKYPLAEL